MLSDKEIVKNADLVNSLNTRGFTLGNRGVEINREVLLSNYTEEALAKALDEDLIAGAGLDVFEVEPIKADNPLLKVKDQNKLVMVPHIGWGSVEARTRLVKDIEESITAFLAGKPRSVVI